MKFLFSKKDNSLTLPPDYKVYIESLKDGKYLLEVKEVGNQRTIQQNAYYHLYLRVISDETGDDVEALHHHFKSKFLTPTSKPVMGEEVVIPPSTTKMSKKEFMGYIAQIEARSGIPAPDTELYLYGYE